MPKLAYHKVSNRFEWGLNSIPLRNFECQARYLSENKYYTISLNQYLNKDFQISPKQQPVIITFDDADQSVYHHAFPILKTYGFTATLFVISDFVGKTNTWDANLGGIYSKHMDWEQIRELSNEGWEIGSHTATHRDLLGLTKHKADEEIRKSKDIIEEKVGKPIHFLSYPFNRFDDTIIALAGQADYRGGCALFSKKRVNCSSKNFNIQRYGVYSIDTLYWFKKKLSRSKIEQLKQRVFSFASLGTILYKGYRK